MSEPSKWDEVEKVLQDDMQQDTGLGPPAKPSVPRVFAYKDLIFKTAALTKEQHEHWKVLGWDSDAPPEKMKEYAAPAWAELDEKQQSAVIELGFSQDGWDEGTHHPDGQTAYSLACEMGSDSRSRNPAWWSGSNLQPLQRERPPDPPLPASFLFLLLYLAGGAEAPARVSRGR